MAELDADKEGRAEAPAEATRAQRHRSRRGRGLVVHPILVAAFPVIFLWAHNLDQGLDLDNVVGPLLLTLAVAAVLWLGGTLLLHDARRAGLIVSFLVVMFFSFGYVGRAMGLSGAGLRVLLLAWAALALIGVVILARGGPWVPGATSGLNLAATVLVGLNIFTIVWAQINPGAANPKFLARGAPTLAPNVLASPPPYKPDIYYIVFDEYGGTSTMRDFFHYNLNPLMQWLTKKGFVVPPESATNYPRTELSIASSMNMRYLEFLTDKLGPNTGNEAPIITLLRHAQIGTIMKSLGYNYIHIGSWWNPTQVAANANVNLVNRGESDFSNLLLQQTAISQVTGSGFRSEAWRTTMWELWTTLHLGKYPGPRFVFTHIVCPHNPLVFQRNGRLLPEAQMDAEGEAKAYTDQHYWVDQQIKKLVTALQNKPPGQQPVIVLQADEGPYPGEPTAWPANPPANQLEMKFDILNAYYMPGVPRSVVWPTITPVNTFRLILDQYFHAGLPRLPDQEYTFVNVQHHLYDFRDVTSLVHHAIWGRPPAPRPIPSGADDLGS